MSDCATSPEICSSAAAASTGGAPQRVRLFGVEIDPLRMSEAVNRVLAWVEAGGECRYVVTPNADHAVLLQEHDGLRHAYADAGMVLVDGMPVLLAAKLLRRGIPERVAGSDLVPALFAAATQRFLRHTGLEGARRLRIYLLGAAPGVAQRAAANIERQWPGVEVAGCHSPPIGFERSTQENEAILARIAAARVDVLIVGLGAPKQELWVHAHRGQIAAPAALCVGATIDFLAGERRRAPKWMRIIGMEWVHRMASEPRRLVKRYLRDAVRLPGMIWREWRSA